MSKRVVTITLALVLGVGSACGLSSCGQSQSQDQNQGETQAQTQSVTDPSEKFLGTWYSAAIEHEGVTLTGDISSLMENVELEVREDGTATLTQGKVTEGTWELTNDDTLSAAFGNSQFVFVYQDGILRDARSGGSSDTSVLFSQDGQLYDKLAIDDSNARDLTEDGFAALSGTSWTLVAFENNGITEWGEPDKLMSLTPTVVESDTLDPSLAFTEEDGDIFVHFLGSDYLYLEYRDGTAALVDPMGGVIYTGNVKAYAGYLLVQFDGFENVSYLFARDDLL